MVFLKGLVKCASFLLWGGKNDTQGIHLAKWLDIQNPKDKGGWGLKYHNFSWGVGMQFYYIHMT
jgi:hypothetical protein